MDGCVTWLIMMLRVERETEAVAFLHLIGWGVYISPLFGFGYVLGNGMHGHSFMVRITH